MSPTALAKKASPPAISIHTPIANQPINQICRMRHPARDQHSEYGRPK